MKKLFKSSIIAAIAVTALFTTGCLTTTTSKVTPSTNAAGVTTFTTNTVTTVNQATLNLDASVLQLVGTPALIYAIQKDPTARPIVVDIQVALQGALQGANTNVVAQITQLAGGDAALDAAITPLIQGASEFEQQELAKYGSVAGVQITAAILNADLNIATAALAATK